MNMLKKFTGLQWMGFGLIAIGLAAPQMSMEGYAQGQHKAAPPVVRAVAPNPGLAGRLQLGMMNTKRLLARAKELTLASIHDNAVRFGIADTELATATALINAVDTLVLDPSLGGLAEVDIDYPGEIRIGPDYAIDLDIDDEAILLLGHELTHVAARDENFSPLIDSVAATVITKTGVQPTIDQVEDLTCDFIGEQALKRYIRESPGAQSIGNRLSATLGYGDDIEEGDEEHLDHEAMIKSWLALDPELGSLLPALSASR